MGGDVIVRVGEWSAKGAKAFEVVSQIKKHSTRPLAITFGAEQASVEKTEETEIKKEKPKSEKPKSEKPQPQKETKIITFEEKSLGIHLHKHEAGVTLSDGNVYNAQIREVLSKAAVRQGLEEGDV